MFGAASGLAPHSPSQNNVSFDSVAWFGRVLTQFGSTAPVSALYAYTPLHCIWYPLLPHFSPHQTSLLLLPVQFLHAAAAASLGCWLMPDSMGEGRQEKVPGGGAEEPAASRDVPV
jgi:hypothetical protein